MYDDEWEQDEWDKPWFNNLSRKHSPHPADKAQLHGSEKAKYYTNVVTLQVLW